MDPLRPRFHIATFLKFTAICSLYLALFHWSGVDFSGHSDLPLGALYPLGIAIVCTLTFMRPKYVPARCQTCGRKCLPGLSTQPNRLCPSCRMVELPPAERRRIEMTALLTIIVLLLIFSFLLLWPFCQFIPGDLGVLAYPVAATGLCLVLFALYVGASVARYLAGSWRMSRPGHALRVARLCARESGKQTTFGPVTVYTFGTNNPTTLLKGQMELCRARLEALVGEAVEVERPLQVFAFGKRSAFELFFRRAFLYTSNLDGMYIPWSDVTMAITTDFPAFRLPDPDRLARVLLGYYHLDAYKRCPSPLWIQMGVANVVACGGDREELFRLNRKMLAAVSRGTVLGAAELFRADPRRLVKPLRDWQDHGNFARITQLTTQSWSVAEYLCGLEAPAGHRERFRGVLQDLRLGEPPEDTFHRHFGHGSDTLLEGWRKWVLARGTGSYEPPPPHMQQALVEHVIPIILYGHAEAIETIQAVREMGRAGYVFGADALIEQLDKEGAIPGDELVWALEAISGLALGHGKTRWASWFASLPDRATDGVVRAF